MTHERHITARFTATKIINGCHRYEARAEDGELLVGCWNDSYPLQVVTYAHSYPDTLGREAIFVMRDDMIMHVLSIEGYSFDELEAIKKRQTRRLSPLDKDPQGPLGYGWHAGWQRQMNSKTKIRNRKDGRLALAYTRRTIYLITLVGETEYATPIWFGDLKEGDILDTDEKITLFEQRCHDLGNVYRHNHSTPWELPVLGTKSVPAETTISIVV